MRKTVVIFASKYGATKKYAQWIGDALSCEVLERKQVKASDLAQYDTILYGGGLYAGGVNGIDLLIKNFDALKTKNLILFTCGLADPNARENVAGIQDSLKKVLTVSMWEKIKVFHLRGGIDYSKLSLIHKMMMAMLRKMTLKKESAALSTEDKQMLETYGQVVDFTDRESIAPIISHVQGL